VARLFHPGNQPDNPNHTLPQPAPDGGDQLNPQPDQPDGDDELDPDLIFPDDDRQGDENIVVKLPGTWVADTDTGFGTTMHTELILEYTGTFSQMVTAGSLMTLDTGTYDVRDGWIRFSVTHHEPTEYKGQPQNWLTGWTYYYSFIDADTVEFTDKIAGSTWQMHRK
jgi:hypothetical protein